MSFGQGVVAPFVPDVCKPTLGSSVLESRATNLLIKFKGTEIESFFLIVSS